MTIEKREQVFVSSTFKDLKEERWAVIQTLLEADCIPSGMELFPASNDEKFDLIKRVIDLCDYYVVVVGGRYGSVNDEQQISYTEMEFDYAVEQGKPVMGFLHGDPGKLAGEKLDLDANLREKLSAFREKIEARMVKYWHLSGDLPGQVALAIMQIRKSHPAEGWIRASEAMTPDVKAELVELRARVRELTADLSMDSWRHEALDPADLVQGEDEAHINCVIDYHFLESIQKDVAYLSNQRHETRLVTPTWNDVIRHLGPDLIDEAAEDRLRESLSELCLTLVTEDLTGPLSRLTDPGPIGQTVGKVYGARATSESFNDVKVQLIALGVIEKGTKRRPNSDPRTYWMLTDRGSQQLIRLRAIRRSVPSDPNPVALDFDV